MNRAMATRLVALLLLAVLATSCETVQNNPKAFLGGAGGAAAGGLIGAAAGGGAAGIVGGVLLGGLLGGAIGNHLDTRSKELAARNAQLSLESARTGQTTTWQNPDSGNSGPSRRRAPTRRRAAGIAASTSSRSSSAARSSSPTGPPAASPTDPGRSRADAGAAQRRHRERRARDAHPLARRPRDVGRPCRRRGARGFETPPAENPRAAHAETDRNKDGYIDHEEFHERLVDVFYTADVNKDGSLSEAEFATLDTKTNFSEMDKNKNGSVSMTEFISFRFRQFEEADTDHDGLLSVREVEVYVGQ